MKKVIDFEVLSVFRKARRRMKLTQDQLANILECSRAQVGDMERGRATPIEMFFRLFYEILNEYEREEILKIIKGNVERQRK